MSCRHQNRKRPWSSSDRDIHEASPNEKRVKAAQLDLHHQQNHGTSAESGTMEGPYAAPEKQTQPMSQILRVQGWRGALCELLDLNGDESDHNIFLQMQEAFAELRRLRDAAPREQLPPTGQIVYKAICHMEGTEALYLNPPRIVIGDDDNGHLHGTQQISNLALYLERHKKISFLVYKTLECCGTQSRSLSEHSSESGGDSTSNLRKFFTRESIRIISEELAAALLSISLEALKDIPHPEFDTFHAEDDSEKEFRDDIVSPYLWWFHRRDEIDQSHHNLTEPMHSHFVALQDYIYDSMSDEWNKVDMLLLEGKITAEYLSYIFVPNSILISKTEGERPQELRGNCVTGWLNVIKRPSLNDFNISPTFQTLYFRKLPEPEADGSFEINKLPLYPVTYASPGVEDSLRQRGRMFWKCRRRNYVYSRSVSDDDIRRSADSRFMVDFWVYRQMHPNEAGLANARQHEPYGDSTPEDEQHLPESGDAFFMCLPTKVFGFNMQKKEWTKLDAEFLEDVQWNEEAFKQLVIEDSTKELVEAVVTHQLQEEGDTDLIRGKGNGLFILLHGGPGTGKTLTAESVAEIAKKPLYRVTCGDIGTKAQDVEEYLERVMLLGKTWGCVVLLDEADVFLEQRSLHNLERNALVSVFLRVLEYYDGIMILTSNRVGIFDEAFKSRIQLTLHYKNLEQWQRLRIWENFLTRMEKLEERRKARKDDGAKVSTSLRFGVDAKGIRDRINELAAANLNGREIRNALSTARQLAVHRKQRLEFQHIERVIDETGKFDTYLTQLRQGFSADEIRHRTGER
ncbi:P-loop containing nucleoside triphosphate hydrolase protein [Colletotrichum zoysiae]|uniref:P-loop containing nucleoside triphosphate hydrolase protein n=1 Tax=Colletotrichum zoysiae TaxID=1216348 RepID=A0AAD9HMA7_9PEZI|nr:P-loop containing nucleoside triphosphate hydrolase protein [Colletotrichum zoysiae]